MHRRRGSLLTTIAGFLAIVVCVGAASAFAVISRVESPECGTCRPDARIADGRAAQSLKDARARWRGQHLTDYSFRAQVLCFCSPAAHRVVVRGGRPVRPPAAVRDVATVPRLFRKVDDAIRDGVHVLRVRYDAGTGMPREIRIDPADEESPDGSVVSISDDDVTYRASHLRR